MSEPLLARLAARGESLAVAALPWVAPVYRAMPQVSELIELPFAHGKLDWAARRRVAGELRGRYDNAYVLPNSFKSALLPWLAGIARRVGYLGEMRYGLLNERLPNHAGRPPMVGYYAALSGDPPQPGERPRLRLPPARIADAALAAKLTPQYYYVFAPGAEYGEAKRWPAERYAELARRLHAQLPLPVLLLGSRKEAELTAGIERAAPGCCVSLAGKTTLDAAIALIAGARAMVSNDSGLMHVAAAFGVAQVAVFGSTSPEHTPPLNPAARVIWLKDQLGLDCMPCFERSCRYGHLRCLREVDVPRVEQALDAALLAAS